MDFQKPQNDPPFGQLQKRKPDMPIYEYVCENCYHEFEVIQKISEPVLQQCPQCCEPSLKRKASISAFHLKGGGWYKDGYSIPDTNGESAKNNDAATPDSAAKESPVSTKNDTAAATPPAPAPSKESSSADSKAS